MQSDAFSSAKNFQRANRLLTKIVHAPYASSKIFFSFYEKEDFPGYCHFLVLKTFIILNGHFAFLILSCSSVPPPRGCFAVARPGVQLAEDHKKAALCGRLFAIPVRTAGRRTAPPEAAG